MVNRVTHESNKVFSRYWTHAGISSTTASRAQSHDKCVIPKFRRKKYVIDNKSPGKVSVEVKISTVKKNMVYWGHHSVVFTAANVCVYTSTRSRYLISFDGTYSCLINFHFHQSTILLSFYLFIIFFSAVARG